MSSKEKVRLACVGLGYWGPNLLRNFFGNPACEVVLACDKDENTRAKIRSMNPGIKLGTDLSEALADPSIQALVLATPAALHFAHVKAALEAGKHVFVEKPLALSLVDAKELAVLAKKCKKALMVGHIYEYNASVRYIKNQIDKGELGKVQYVYAQRLNLGKVRHDLDAIWNLAPHDISILNLWMGGSPSGYSAWGITALPHRFADVGFLLLDYPNGVKAHVHISWLDPGKVRKITVVGSKKMVVYDDVDVENPVRVYDKGVDVADGPAPQGFGEFKMQVRSGDVHMPRIDALEPLRVECDHFVACVRDGKEPDTNGDSGAAVVAVLEAVDESRKRGGARVELKAS